MKNSINLKSNSYQTIVVSELNKLETKKSIISQIASKAYQKQTITFNKNKIISTNIKQNLNSNLILILNQFKLNKNYLKYHFINKDKENISNKSKYNKNIILKKQSKSKSSILSKILTNDNININTIQLIKDRKSLLQKIKSKNQNLINISNIKNVFCSSYNSYNIFENNNLTYSDNLLLYNNLNNFNDNNYLKKKLNKPGIFITYCVEFKIKLPLLYNEYKYYIESRGITQVIIKNSFQRNSKITFKEEKEGSLKNSIKQKN